MIVTCTFSHMNYAKYSGLKYNLIKKRPKRLFTINHSVKRLRIENNTKPF